MSKSFKKSPFSAVTTSVTEKHDKRLANRSNRRINKVIAQDCEDSIEFKLIRETSDVWSMSKDGKYRFNPVKNKKLMRK